jgi:hypothetical protein
VTNIVTPRQIWYWLLSGLEGHGKGIISLMEDQAKEGEPMDNEQLERVRAAIGRLKDFESQQRAKHGEAKG